MRSTLLGSLRGHCRRELFILSSLGHIAPGCQRLRKIISKSGLFREGADPIVVGKIEEILAQKVKKRLVFSLKASLQKTPLLVQRVQDPPDE